MHKKIYLIAGETSGDVLGGRLMNALKQQSNDFVFGGIGGPQMEAEGMHSLFAMNDLSVMGVFEVLPKLPLLMRRIRQTVDDIIAKQPNIVVTIDAPDFCKRVVKKAKKHCPNTKFIHYVAPTVWAWRPGRAKLMAKLFDGLICLLPFEPPHFEKFGLNTQYCGHPLVEEITDSREERVDDHILILPGSRLREIKIMGPIFADVFKRMQTMNPSLKAFIPALPHVKEEIDQHFEAFDNIYYVDPNERFQAFKKAPFALATSGTVGLELAVAECPHVIAYKTNKLTWWLLKRLIRVQYAHLVNIMNDQEMIPECLQENANTDHIMNSILSYKYPDFAKMRDQLLGADKSKKPSQQAADFIVIFLN